MFKVTVTRLPVAVEFEIGSLSEAIGILQDKAAEFRTLISIADELADDGETSAEAGDVVVTTGEATATVTKGKRGRPPTKNKVAETATAPDPIAIPGTDAPATAPVDLTPGPNGIPAAFDRTAQAAAAAPPPPPPPPLPPVAAAPPPAGILAGKVIANLDLRKGGAADGGKSIVDWLASSRLVTAGATYDDAIAALRLLPDDKLAGIATALQIA